MSLLSCQFVGAEELQHRNIQFPASIPALISVVDKRVETILGAAVSTIEAAATRVESATQRRLHRSPRTSGKNRAVALDEYDGDTELSPKKFRGPKPTKINKQHVRVH
jgi:hypothetical protein